MWDVEPGDFVIIEWLDASCSGGWTKIKSKKKKYLESAATLAHQDEDFIYLSFGHNKEETDEWLGELEIPQGMVKSVTLLA